MRDTASSTAAWVAAARGLAHLLPAEARLVEDPHGLAFGGAVARAAASLPAFAMAPARPFLLYMQVRTRVIDDVVAAFCAGGGRQIVLLGAGYDARAARLAPILGESRVYEVDHPATQARKKEVLAGAPGAEVTYLPWDFERRPVSELPAALREAGHDPAAPTLTIWEGVTMYLSEQAIDASVRAVGDLSSPGSPFVITYLDRAVVERPSPARKVVATFVARVGEPWRFGWAPADLPAWFGLRGYRVAWDRDAREHAGDLLPERYAAMLRIVGHRIALLERAPGAP